MDPCNDTAETTMAERMEMAAALAQAAREINAPRDLPTTIRAIVDVARESMPGIDHVGISVLRRDGSLETTAWSDEGALAFDGLQQELGEGPTVEAMRTAGPIRVEHAERERRWLRFVPRAVDMGLRSQLTLPLTADGVTIGALTMYSTLEDTLSEDTEKMAELFATHAGLALSQARRVDNLTIALETRKVIGLALGMVMERLQIDEDTAFAYLTRVSRSTETKIRDVATRIVQDHHAELAPRQGSAS